MGTCQPSLRRSTIRLLSCSDPRQNCRYAPAH
jgi:hypothetical protein